MDVLFLFPSRRCFNFTGSCQQGRPVKPLFCLVSIYLLFISVELPYIFFRKSKVVGVVHAGGDNIQLEMRIEHLKVFDRDADHFTYLIESNNIGYFDRTDITILINRLYRMDIMFTMIIHHIRYSDKSRNITSCFSWKIWPDFPVIPCSAGSANCLVDIPGTRVIGCKDQKPVSIDFIEITHMPARRHSSLLRIETIFNER